MRNVLTLLGTGLLAGCCLMHFHVPITEQTRTNAQTFGSLGQRLLPDGTPPERIAAFRQCLSVAYMGHYGEGEAGAAREREGGYALFWQILMAAAPTYMRGAGNDTKPIRVLSWRRAGHGPGSSLSGAARVCFRTRIVTVCLAFFRAFRMV